MAPCLSKFPSVCLEAIFKQVPLVDLFYSVGLVCSSWYTSRRIELIRRRRLRLVDCSDDDETLNYLRVQECSHDTELIERVRRDDGSPWHTLESLEHIKFNCLPVPDGTKTIPFFSSLMNMSNITCLKLNIYRTTSDVTQVIRLIDNLSKHLVHLKLDVDFIVNFDEPDNEDTNARALRELSLCVTNLIDCLNRLPSLRHLNLALYNLSSNPPLLSCLSRLTTFAIRAHVFYGFRVESMDGWIYGSIKQYAQNVTSIDLYKQVELREMLQFDARLDSKFNVLNVNYDADEDFDDMSLFCAHFCSLTKLELNLISVPLPMTKLGRCLSLLTQLVNLDLYFDDIPPIEIVQPEEGDQAEQVLLQITQIPSVRLLKMHIVLTSSHHDSERLFIPEIFPHLQVLRWEHRIVHVCPECEITPMIDDSDNEDDENEFDRIVEDIDPERALRIAECKRLIRQPFRRCLHLHTVALVDRDKETLIELGDL